MLFALRFAEPVARGEVDLTFRRWKRAQVRPGRPYRTPVGRLQVDEVDVVSPGELQDADARRAGFDSVEAMLAEADKHAAPDAELYRVRFHKLDEPDPRSELAASVPDADDLTAVRRRLDAMDARSARAVGLGDARGDRRAPRRARPRPRRVVRSRDRAVQGRRPSAQGAGSDALAARGLRALPARPGRARLSQLARPRRVHRAHHGDAVEVGARAARNHRARG